MEFFKLEKTLLSSHFLEVFSQQLESLYQNLSYQVSGNPFNQEQRRPTTVIKELKVYTESKTN